MAVKITFISAPMWPLRLLSIWKSASFPKSIVRGSCHVFVSFMSDQMFGPVFLFTSCRFPNGIVRGKLQMNMLIWYLTFNWNSVIKCNLTEKQIVYIIIFWISILNANSLNRWEWKTRFHAKHFSRIDYSKGKNNVRLFR